MGGRWCNCRRSLCSSLFHEHQYQVLYTRNPSNPDNLKSNKNWIEISSDNRPNIIQQNNLFHPRRKYLQCSGRQPTNFSLTFMGNVCYNIDFLMLPNPPVPTPIFFPGLDNPYFQSYMGIYFKSSSVKSFIKR